MFYEHFNEHDDCFSIFTDGSKTDEGVGYAIAYESSSESRRIPKEASVYTAELLAILLALKRVYQMRPKSFVIVSDSRSALMAIESYNSPHPIVIEIQEWFHLITTQQKEVKFCWVLTVDSHRARLDPSFHFRGKRTCKMPIPGINRQYTVCSAMQDCAHGAITI